MNKYDEFNEKERKLSEMLIQASKVDLEEQGIYFESVDYSFMEEIESEIVENRCEKPVVKKRYSRHLIRAAVILLCFAALVFGCSFWLISQEVEADDFTLEKLIHRIKDGLYGTVEGDYIDENTTSITVTSLDDVKKAKRFAPDLKVPGWLPEGTKLVELTVTKQSKEITAVWEFVIDKKNAYLMQMQYNDKMTFSMFDIVDTIEECGRMYYIGEDLLTDTNYIALALDNIILTISGNLSVEELMDFISEI